MWKKLRHVEPARVDEYPDERALLQLRTQAESELAEMQIVQEELYTEWIRSREMAARSHRRLAN